MAKRVGVFCLVTALFLVAFRTFLDVQPASDLTEHIGYAQRIRSRADITSPHFLFQLLVKGGERVGLSYGWAAVLVLAVAYGVMAMLIVREIERRGAAVTPFRAFLLVPAVLVASHIFLFTLWRANMYYGYFVPIAYHNPTQQLGKLFAIWIAFRYGASFLETASPTLGRAAAIAVLCLLCAVSKPSFLLAFLPAAGIVAIADMFTRRWKAVALFAGVIALPASALLLWQATVAYQPDGSSGIALAPFALFDPVATIYKLPLSLAFPLCVWAFAWRYGVRDAKLRFTALMTAIGLFITLFMAEEASLGAGNFAWTGQTVVFLAYVECALFLVCRPALDATVPWQRAAWAVFAAHVVSGVIWYAAVFFPARPDYL